jgi:TRAP-type C4-dicarboxylate transport system substrate-binding protein
VTKTKQKPTADELAGLAWWNGLTEEQRRAALEAANTAIAAEAWRHHCRVERNLTLAAKALAKLSKRKV